MEKRLKSSEVLRLAQQKYLPDFVCFAVSYAEYELLFDKRPNRRYFGHYGWQPRCAVAEWLAVKFESETVIEWAQRNVPGFAALPDDAPCFETELQSSKDYRYDWVTLLIQHYESIGD